MSMQKIAVLHSALLVRKGEAKPSLFDSSPPSPVEWVRDARPSVIPDSDEGRGGGETRTMAPVGLASLPARSASTAPRGRGRKDRRVAFTLRLDTGRHRRLRIFSACTRRSIQDLLTSALDDFLAREASAADRDCPCLGVAARPSETVPDEDA